MVNARRAIAPGQLVLGLDVDPVGIAAELTRRLVARSPGSLVIPELGLAIRRARVDIAHVTDHLAGFEIKGSRDDLDRLDHQQAAFSATFERMTRPQMVGTISAEMSPVEISRAVCAAFRARRRWRTAA